MKRIVELDALRGIAALVIVVFHLWFIRVPVLGTAVDLFFVMSGYLITTIILAQRTESGFLWKFYARRSLRIWPIYYLALVATLLLCMLFSSPIDPRGVPFALTYTQHLPDYIFAPTIEFSVAFRHTWTLAIEEQFYLIWPLALYLGGRKALVPLASGFIVLAIVTRGIGFTPWILMTRADGLALGGLLAALFTAAEESMGRKRIRPWQVLAATLGLAVVARVAGTLHIFGMNESWSQSFKMLAMNLAYFSLIGFVVLGAGGRATAVLRLPALIWLGQVSYGIYLYHHIIFYFVDYYGPASRVAADALKLSLTFGVATLSWVYIERPILSLKSRFDYHVKPRTLDAANPDGITALPTPA